MRIGLQLFCSKALSRKAKYIVATFCKVLQLQFIVLDPNDDTSNFDGLLVRYCPSDQVAASFGGGITVHQSDHAETFFATDTALQSQVIHLSSWGSRYVPLLFVNGRDLNECQDVVSNLSQQDGVSIHFDLFASAFYFLSSWEEGVIAQRDQHGRFQYKDSLAAKLAIPENIVDIYLDIFIEAINRANNGRWPIVEIPKWDNGAQFVVCLTHDVDEIKKSYLSRLKFLGNHLARPVSAHQATPLPERFFFAFSSLISRKDPYWTYPDYPPVEKSYGFSASYFFQSELNGNAYYSLTEPQISSFMTELISDGFEIGLHGTYRSAVDKEKFREEYNLLNDEIEIKLEGHRQHFLRMKHDETFSIYEEAGIAYDATLGYAEQEGYRNQFSYPFHPFNHQENRAFYFLELPTVIMDVTLASYRNLCAEKAWLSIENWLQKTALRRGCLTLLWHNPWEGIHPQYFELYMKILDWIKANSGTGLSGRDVLYQWRKR